jgi:F-box/leucine-rich repeat protein 14
VSSLVALTPLSLAGCDNVPAEGLRAVSSLTKLSALDLSSCNLTAEGFRAVSRLTTLTSLGLCICPNLTDEVLRGMSSLTALKFLNLYRCDNVTVAGKQALRTALPNLTIRDS